MRSFCIGFALLMMFAFAPFVLLWWAGEEAQGRKRFWNGDEPSTVGVVLIMISIIEVIVGLIVYKFVAP